MPGFGGDLDEIKSRGVLRIIVPANLGGQRFLPRKGSPVLHQRQVIQAFARSQGLREEEVVVNNFSEILPALQQGYGDIIVANLTINNQRREKIGFSVPLTHVLEQILIKADNNEIKKPEDLSGKFVMVDRSSSFWSTIQKMKKKVPDMQVLERPAGLRDEQELDLLANGDIHAVIRDSNIAEMYLGYRSDIKVAFEYGEVRDIAWGLRKDAPKLKSALDHFLHIEHFADQQASTHTDDLDGIRKRKVLRILLRNNASSYFLYRGELMGFEYEMAKAFAKANKLRLEVIVPDTHEQLLEWLAAGKADMAAGFLEPLESRKQMGISFSRPYHFTSKHIVVHKDNPIEKVEDLFGKTVHLRQSSAYWEALSELNQQLGGRIRMIPVDEDTETESLIQKVASKEIEITMADEHVLDLELTAGVEVKSAFVVGEEHPSSVAIRQNNPKLLKALNGFIKKNYKGLVYNVLYKKYFKSPRLIKKVALERSKILKEGKLSPYDNITRRYAEEYGFDWRLITAQMYQESRFDPKAKSYAGAKGLLQVMPKTAKSMGFKNLEKPEIGIHAGIKYMDWVRNRFDNDLPFAERMWLTLASYNAGYGHVADARRLAKKQGLDPDVWFGNVEQAMLLLSKKKYYKKARHGYVRGREPVNYVSNIRQRFDAYVELTQDRIAVAD